MENLLGKPSYFRFRHLSESVNFQVNRLDRCFVFHFLRFYRFNLCSQLSTFLLRSGYEVFWVHTTFLHPFYSLLWVHRRMHLYNHQYFSELIQDLDLWKQIEIKFLLYIIFHVIFVLVNLLTHQMIYGM